MHFALIVYCNSLLLPGMKLCCLKNLRLLELFVSIVLKKRKERKKRPIYAIFKRILFSFRETDLWVTQGEFTIKKYHQQDWARILCTTEFLDLNFDWAFFDMMSNVHKIVPKSHIFTKIVFSKLLFFSFLKEKPFLFIML